MKLFLINLLIITGFFKAYSGTADIIIASAAKSDNSTKGDSVDRPSTGCTGCIHS